MRALQIAAFIIGAVAAWGRMEDALAGPNNATQQAREISRAVQVRDSRNAIVSQTLERVGVDYGADDSGIPVWIELAGRKMPVRAVRVSPVGESADHQVAITTAQGTLLLREP